MEMKLLNVHPRILRGPRGGRILRHVVIPEDVARDLFGKGFAALVNQGGLSPYSRAEAREARGENQKRASVIKAKARSDAPAKITSETPIPKKGGKKNENAK